jgi:hypothetical protein
MNQPVINKPKGNQMVLIVTILIFLLICGGAMWWFFTQGDAGTDTPPTPPPPPTCLDEVKKACNLDDTLTCQTYAECLQSAAMSQIRCTDSDWFKTNCSDFKPNPGGGDVTNTTFTWSGPYFKISTFGNGIQSDLGVDFTKIDTVVLNVDFSDSYIRNNSGTFFSFASSTGQAVEGLKKTYKDIQVTISPSDIQPVPYTGVISRDIDTIGQVTIANSNIQLGLVEFSFNTNQYLGNKKVTFTFKFIKN